MTGFFEMPVLDQDASPYTLDTVLHYLDTHVPACFSSNFLDTTDSDTSTDAQGATLVPIPTTTIPLTTTATTAPKIKSLDRRAEGNHLSIRLHVPKHFHSFVEGYKYFMQTQLSMAADREPNDRLARYLTTHSAFRIRPKNIDHISLAYRRLPHRATGMAMNTEGSYSMGGSSLVHPVVASLRDRHSNSSPSANGTTASAVGGFHSSSLSSSSAFYDRFSHSSGSTVSELGSFLSMDGLSLDDGPFSGASGAHSAGAAATALRDRQLTAETMSQLDGMAREMVDISTPVQHWSIVFYEVVRKSDSVHIPHHFKELRRYRIV